MPFKSGLVKTYLPIKSGCTEEPDITISLGVDGVDRDRTVQVLPVLSYPVLQDAQMLALLEVQAVPVALTPFEQEQVFDVHTRLAAEEHAVVSLVPAPHPDRHPVHVLPFL